MAATGRRLQKRWKVKTVNRRQQAGVRNSESKTKNLEPRIKNPETGPLSMLNISGSTNKLDPGLCLKV